MSHRRQHKRKRKRSDGERADPAGQQKLRRLPTGLSTQAQPSVPVARVQSPLTAAAAESTPASSVEGWLRQLLFVISLIAACYAVVIWTNAARGLYALMLITSAVAGVLGLLLARTRAAGILGLRTRRRRTVLTVLSLVALAGALGIAFAAPWLVAVAFLGSAVLPLWSLIALSRRAGRLLLPVAVTTAATVVAVVAAFHTSSAPSDQNSLTLWLQTSDVRTDPPVRLRLDVQFTSCSSPAPISLEVDPATPRQRFKLPGLHAQLASYSGFRR
jgi:hypothetical protein